MGQFSSRLRAPTRMVYPLVRGALVVLVTAAAARSSAPVDMGTNTTMDGINYFVLTEATATVNSVAFSADSKLLASGSGRKVRVYALGDAAPSLKYTLDDATECVNSVAFSADSKLLASGSGRKVRVYALG